MTNYQDLLKECESHIRAGHDHRVVKILGRLNLAKVPRVWRLPLANLARRTSQIATGLRILTAVVRSGQDRSANPATPAELAEYAILLQRAGSVIEALEVLKSVDSNVVPAALLYRAFCHFNLWQYEEALPVLRQYLDLIDDPYQKLVARVNLGAALVATGRFDTAEEILKNCAQSAKAGGHTRLLGNAHELLSQCFLLTGDLREAGHNLDIASGIFSVPGTLEYLFTEKCRAFLNSKLSGSPEALKKFRQQAVVWPHAETVREADLFSLIVEFDPHVFEHLYFGTPFASYRARIEKHLGLVPEMTEFTLGRGPRSLHAETGLLNGKEVFARGGVSHRLVAALAQDFYRPARTNTVFALLYPDEHFNIFSSPGRVHQAVRRVRREFEALNLPLEIVHSVAGFQLKLGPGMSMQVPRAFGAVGIYECHIEKLSCEVRERGFSATEARALLSLSASAMQRFLSWAQHNGHIEKFGASTATLYYIVDKRAA